MFQINISQGKDYYSQRNNRRFPLSTCNTTSMIQGLVASSIPLPAIPAGVQAEDFLTDITESREMYEARSKLGSGFADIPPRQIHVLLSQATNKFVGRKVTEFREAIPIRRLLWELHQGRASVVTGSFTSFGHIVTLVGYRSKQSLEEIKSEKDINLSKVEGMIIDDPYGNYYDGYKTLNGNDVFMPFSDFNKITRRYGSTEAKWAHIFLEGGHGQKI